MKSLTLIAMLLLTCLLLTGSGADDKSAPVAKEKPVPAAKPKTNVAVPQIRHNAVGARVVVSSTHTGEPGERGPEALVDGNLLTRWSSEYSTPQKVVVYLKNELKLSTLRLHWEQAYATRYKVSVLTDAKTWKHVHIYFEAAGKPKEKVDVIDLKDISATAVKIDLLAPVDPTWGFSLYEVEVIAAK